MTGMWTREPEGYVNAPWAWFVYEQGQRRKLIESLDTPGRIEAAVNPHRTTPRRIRDLSDTQLSEERLHWLWEVENATKWSAALAAAAEFHSECISEMQRRGLRI